ncbi:MAG TPA: helix-turn-helix domain-containing protein [Planctomycetaceae bacterium]|nr:helix-turn-helix domain-containing protein [Planctomycetaceae bacterium]
MSGPIPRRRRAVPKRLGDGPTRKQHDQYCPIARTLDVLGDRWSLLILRELLLGDRRFVDLREWLPGVSPTLLTKRLQQLTANGLVATIELPPPAARTVYTATARGREAVPILRAMSRFGMKLLPPPRASTKLRPESVAYAAVDAWYDSGAANGIDEIYRLVIDGAEFTLASARGAARENLAKRAPDLVLTAPGHVLVAARLGETTLADAVASGAATVTGRKHALRNFQRVFRLP